MVLSVAQITSMGHIVRFEKHKVTITNSGGESPLEGYSNASNLYTVDNYSKTTDKWGPLPKKNVPTDEIIAECLMLQNTGIKKVAEVESNVRVTIEGTQKTCTTNYRVEK